jgi:secondary thiamine-phosphate synthase enzyme
MSKRSTVTVREQPVTPATSVSGALTIHSDTFTIQTGQRIELCDVTERVMALVRRMGVREGTVNIVSMHTTCTVLINEFQRALLSDIQTFLEEVVSRDAKWKHNDPAHSDCDRMNADAHLRALLLGHSLTLQVSGGEIVLGQWQRILVAELDGPRARTLRVQVMGVC